MSERSGSQLMPDTEELKGWRRASITLNPKRRFRHVVDLRKREGLLQRQQSQVADTEGLKGWRKVSVAFDTSRRFRHVVDLEKPDLLLQRQQFADITTQADVDLLKKLGGVAGLARKLKVDPKTGLNYEQCSLHRKMYGENIYPKKPPRRFRVYLSEAWQEATLIILVVCAFVSIAGGVAFDDLEEAWYEGAGLIFFLTLGVLITALSDFKQDLQFKAVDKEKNEIVRQEVDVTREGSRKRIHRSEVVVGDIVHLSVGNEIPADGVLIEGHELAIDESNYGSSEPQDKFPGEPFLFSGTTVQDGSGLMLVTSVGRVTMWGNWMAEVSDDQELKPPWLFVTLTKLSTGICRLGSLLALLTFLVLLGRLLYEKCTAEVIWEWGVQDAVAVVRYAAIAVAMVKVASSEDLPLLVNLTFAFATKKLMSDKALVRHWAGCETMGSATAICIDKTGTLTINKMIVEKAWVGGRIGTVNEVGQVSPAVLDVLIESIYTSTRGHVQDDVMGPDGEPVLQGQGMEKALLRFGLDLGGHFHSTREKFNIVKKNPFHPDRMQMGVAVRHHDGHLRAHWKGAPELVLKLCDRFINGKGNVVPLTEEAREHLTATTRSFADQALKTLCLAYSDLSQSHYDMIPEKKFVCLAIVGIKDPVRPDAPEAIKLCRSVGMEVRMITGDNTYTAIAVARECGILTDGQVVEGPVFRTWSNSEKDERIPYVEVIARMSPSDKVDLVKCLQRRGEIVAVIGDAANDAPALHKADIGMAMGISGSDDAKQSADVILLDDSFGTIEVVAKWGRAVYTNVQKIFQFHLKVTLVALLITPIGDTPLSAMQLIWIDLITENLAPLALASEPPHDDLLTKKSIGRNGRFITNVMWRNIAGQVLYQLIVLILLRYKGKDILHLEGSETELQAQLNTMIFNVIVFCQVFNEVNARELGRLNVFAFTVDNWVFLLIITVTILLQWIVVTFLGRLANTVPLNGDQWLITVGIGAVSILVSTAVKFIPVPADNPVPSNPETSGYQALPGEPPEQEDV